MPRGCRSIIMLLALWALLGCDFSPQRLDDTLTAVVKASVPADKTDKSPVRPQLVVQLGHAQNVLAVAYAVDGRTALTGSDDQTARLWDLVTSKEIRRFEGHSDAIVSVAMSVDGQHVLTGSSDATARLWNAATGTELRRFEHAAAVTSVTFSPNGKQVLTGHDHQASLWDADTGRLLREFTGHGDPVLAVAISADGSQVLTGSADHQARLWDAQSGQLLQELKGHSEPITSVAFAPDGTRLLTGSLDGTARCWDADSGGELQQYRAPRRIFSVAFSPDGQLVITGNEGVAIKLDDEQNNTVRVWDALSGTPLRGFRAYGSSAVSISVSPDGKRVLVGAAGSAFSGDDGRAQLWDLNTGNQLRMLVGQGVVSVERVACSADGRWLLVGGDDGAAWLWDAATGREVQRFQPDGSRIQSVALSADGRIVLTGGDDGIARLWDAATGKERRRLEGHTDGIVSVALSPDGQAVLTGSTDSTARLWDVASRRELHRFAEYEGETVYAPALSCSVAFSPDGQSILTGQWDNTARLWDRVSGQELQCFEGHNHHVVSVAFTSDGRQVLTGSWDKTARLWDVQTGTEVLRLSGHSGAVSSVAISPSGDQILTGSWDNIARLWDARTGAELRTFPGLTRGGQSVALAANGTRAVTANLDKTAVLWNLSAQEPLCTLIHSSGGTVAATPAGNYMAPKGALQCVAFGIENRALPFDQFDLKYNRPDLVLDTIGLAPNKLVSAYRRAYQNRIAKLGFTEEQLGTDFHVPETAILSQIPLTTSEPTLSLTIRASDTKFPLDRVSVDVNGVPMCGSAGISLRVRNLKDWQHEIEIELSTGPNVVRVSAVNSQGAESLPETFETRCDAEAKPPDLFVVAVGVSKYQDRRFRLNYARKDARDVATLWKAKGKRFGQVHVAQFLDEDATRDNILGAKQRLLQSHVNDEVVVFLAGHGLLDKQLDYYFATVDLDFANPARQGLSYAAIEDLLDGIPARKKLLMMDTCHSGEVDKQGVKGTTTNDTEFLSRRLLEEMFADLRRGTGAAVISAAGGAEVALESSAWNNGAFTHVILHGLKTAKADHNRDGQVQVSELRDYVMDAVPRMTRGRQTPTTRRENLAQDFPVY